MSVAAAATLHTEGSEPAGDALDAAQLRVEQRDANLKKARAASAAARKAGGGKRKRGRPPKNRDAAPVDAPAADAPTLEILDAPVTSARELAQFIASAETSLAAVAPLAGPKAQFLVAALQWSDGKGKPTPQCEMAAKFMWPWLAKQDAFGKLAAQADGVMFAAGVCVLIAPFLTTCAMLFLQPAPAPQSVPGEQPAPVTEATQPKAVA